MALEFKQNGYGFCISGDGVQLTHIYSGREIYIPKYVTYEDKRYQVVSIAPIPIKDYYSINVEKDGRRRPKYERRYYKKYVNIVGKQIDERINCVKTEQIHFHDSIHTIGDYAFYKFGEIRDIELPTELKVIGNYSFYGCEELRTLYLPNVLGAIGDHAFAECTRLKSILIPESVTSIGSNAFYNCESLTKVIIGPGIKSIGSYAFCQKWSNLESVEIYADPFEVMISPSAFNSNVKVTYHNPNKYRQKNIAPSKRKELSALISLLNSSCECKTDLIENNPTNINNNSNDIDIEKLIDAVVADGVITEKERTVILKKATSAGYDADEVEILLDARAYKKRNAQKETEEPVKNKSHQKKQKPVEIVVSAKDAPKKEVNESVSEFPWGVKLWEPIKTEMLKQATVKMSIPRGKSYAIISSGSNKGLLQYILQYSVRVGEAKVCLETYGGEDAKGKLEARIAACPAGHPLKKATISQGQRNKEKWAWTIVNKIDNSDASLVDWYVDTLLAVYTFIEDTVL